MRAIRVTSTAVLHGSVALVNISGILLTLTLLSDSLGIIDRFVLHLAALFLLVGVTLLNLPVRRTVHNLIKITPLWRATFFGVILLTVAFLLLLLSPTPTLWMASIPLLLSGLHLTSQTDERRHKELPLLAAASFGYAVVYLLIQTIPPLWHLLQQFSLLFSHGAGIITGTPLLLGPSASDLWILLIILTFLCSSILLTPKKTQAALRRFLICVLALFLIWIFYLCFLSFVSFSSNADTMTFHPVFFFLCLIPLLLYLLKYDYREDVRAIPFMKPRTRTALKTGAAWAAVLLFLSTTVLTVLIIPNSSGDNHPGKVLFSTEHMLGTWDVPQYGKYGRDGVGMFGLWPVYLSTLGYEPELLVENATMFLNSSQPPNRNISQSLNISDYVSIIESPTVTKELLEDIRVFVVTNLNASFTPEEQGIIWEYVNNGGSLLVLGDHTNVGGIQQPLNDLLTPVGIRFRFDAALPLDETQKWLTCTRLLHHPVTVALAGVDELQYGVGGSLDISPGAFPIVIGTYALSDNGNRSGADVAYLGDYAYNKGEQLGDVILVAAAYHGDGKILVFGDTSSFQNSALPFSYPFLRSTFSWLASTPNNIMSIVQIGLALLLFLGAILLVRFSKKNTVPFALFPVMLAVALVMTTSVNPMLIPQNTPRGPLVSIDASHIERFAQEPFTDESVNGLILNLQRNNYLPILLRRFSDDTIASSQIFICIAATASFNEAQLNVLKHYMADGGYIILATGYDDREATLPLLSVFNMSIDPVPLGPVPYVEANTSSYENEPRFVDSWPLTFSSNQATSYYNFTWDDTTYNLVVFQKYGSGGLLVISDSQFLLDKNIESIYDYWPGNIIFLKHLLDELRTMEGHQ
jgi:hypothetical protein